MSYDTYLVESIIDNIRNRQELKQADNIRINKEKKRRAKYLRYQQAGGRLSIDNFENKEMRQYELDHKRNPKMYPNFKTWKRITTQDREKKASLEEKESRNRRRRAQAKHEESIARLNKQKADRNDGIS